MKYFAVIACVLALSASSHADGLGGLVYAPGHSSVDYYSYPSYAFEYAVKDPQTGDNKAQWEKREGDVVRGAYSLVEPDGSVRVVEYKADDKSGFNAVVKRIGPSLHPVVTPIYKAPLPVVGYKSEIPISIGPVAGLNKLAGAPLLNPYLGGATSSAVLYKTPVTSIIKEVAPIAPVIQAPIISEPILKSPLYQLPILKNPLYQLPILKNQVLPLSLLKSPIVSEPLPYIPRIPIPIQEPIYPSLKAPISEVKILEPLNIGKYNFNQYDIGLLGKGLLNNIGLENIGLGYKGIK